MFHSRGLLFQFFFFILYSIFSFEFLLRTHHPSLCLSVFAYLFLSATLPSSRSLPPSPHLSLPFSTLFNLLSRSHCNGMTHVTHELKRKNATRKLLSHSSFISRYSPSPFPLRFSSLLTITQGMELSSPCDVRVLMQATAQGSNSSPLLCYAPILAAYVT